LIFNSLLSDFEYLKEIVCKGANTFSYEYFGVSATGRFFFDDIVKNLPLFFVFMLIKVEV